MHNIIKKTITLVFSVSLFMSMFFSSINFVVYNKTYYEWHYINRDIELSTGMNLNDLMVVTDVFIEYLQDKRDNLNVKASIDGRIEEVFNEREKAHMVDVKLLALMGERIRVYSGLLVIGILFFALFKDKKLIINLLNSIKYVFVTLSLLIIGIGALLVSDFNKYFTIFHEIFFNNDLWLLDPRTDILINIVPEIFFYTTAMLVIIIFITMITVTILCAELIKRKLIKKLG